MCGPCLLVLVKRGPTPKPLFKCKAQTKIFFGLIKWDREVFIQRYTTICGQGTFRYPGPTLYPKYLFIGSKFNYPLTSDKSYWFSHTSLKIF